MSRKLWLLFTQVVTVALALGMVASTYWPGLIGKRVTLQVVELSGDAGNSSQSYGDALSNVLPSIVKVYSHAYEGTSSMDGETRVPLENLGSGVIISSDGYILTNHHVVADAGEIEIGLGDGTVYYASLVGSDPRIDLAVLKIAGNELPAATFGDDDSVRVGDVVMAIGNPFGLSQSVSMGIVSAVGRDKLGLNRYEHFIQTDAAINPGSSGGALTNVSGELIGINSALYSREQGAFAYGIGFAIPASLARDAFVRILEENVIDHGWLGIGLERMSRAMLAAVAPGHNGGLLVASVDEDSPAEKIGLRVGDALVLVGGREPSEITVRELASGRVMEPGLPVELTVIRGGAPITLTISPELDLNAPATRRALGENQTFSL